MNIQEKENNHNKNHVNFRFQFDSVVFEKEARIKELEKNWTQLSHSYDLVEKELGKSRSNESKLSKELNQVKMEVNALNETCTRQRVDFEMELSEANLSTNARLQELSEKLNASEIRSQELEQQLAEKSSRLEAALVLEASLREELEGKESTIVILKNSLMVKSSTTKGYLMRVFLRNITVKIVFELVRHKITSYKS